MSALRSRHGLLLALPPAGLLLAWVVLLFASFGGIVEVIYANADISSATVIGELFPKAPSGASTVLGYHPWYTTLWFELATRWVPFHRQVWEVGPWVAAVAGLLLVAWSTAKVAGRWAGWLVAVVLICASPRLLTIQFGSDLHGATAVNVCVLGAFLVLLVTHGGRIGSQVTHVLLCVLVSAVTAAGLSSDVLLVPAGLVPLVAAGIAQLRWTPGTVGRRVALSASLVAAAAIAGAEIAIAAMHRVHVYTGAHTVAFVPWSDLLDNLLHYLQSLTDLFNGDFGGAAVTARSTLALACALVVGAGLVVGLRMGLDQIERLQAARPATTAAREAYVTFWFLALALPSAAFVFLTLGQVGLGRYLVASGYGVVALAVVGLGGRGYAGRVVLLAAACVLVTASVVSLAAGDIEANSGHYPRRDVARFLSTFAQGEGLKYGYAAYWVAAPLTWESRLRVEVYPVVPCPTPSGLCSYPWHEISSWYTPRPATRTFLVTDKRYGPGVSDFHLADPAEVVSYGEYEVYVYGYDIASKLGDPRRYGVTGS
jgi:hypothetical protein